MRPSKKLSLRIILPLIFFDAYINTHQNKKASISTFHSKLPPHKKKNIYIYTTCVEINVLHSFRAFLGGVNVFWSLGNILNLQVFPSSRSRPWACTLLRCSLGRGLGGNPYMDVSLKIGEFPPKMDGENNGKVYNQMDDFGGKRYHYFLETSYYTYIMNG